MQVAGERILSLHKTDIKDRKPGLKLCPNHLHSVIGASRTWNQGPAVVDGKKWYKSAPGRGAFAITTGPKKAPEPSKYAVKMARNSVRNDRRRKADRARGRCSK